MVFAGGKRNANANIATDEKNHAALDVLCVFGGKVSFLGCLASYVERAEKECCVSSDNRNCRSFKYAEQVKCVQNKHDRERNAENPWGAVIRVACARVAVNEQRLHDHEKANAKQRVVAAVV